MCSRFFAGISPVLMPGPTSPSVPPDTIFAKAPLIYPGLSAPLSSADTVLWRRSGFTRLCQRCVYSPFTAPMWPENQLMQL